MIKVRDAELDDVLYLIPAMQRYYATDGRSIELDIDTLSTYIIAMLQDNSCHLFVAESDGGVTGCAGMLTNSALGFAGPLIAQEMFWHVDPAFTKTKTGSKLFAAMESRANDVGAESMIVSVPATEHSKRIGNSCLSKGYRPLCQSYIRSI